LIRVFKAFSKESIDALLATEVFENYGSLPPGQRCHKQANDKQIPAAFQALWAYQLIVLIEFDKQACPALPIHTMQ
jgi:hypothetical protein